MKPNFSSLVLVSRTASLVFVLFAMSAPQAFAQVWNGNTDGNWSVGTNWNGGIAPATGAAVNILGTLNPVMTNDPAGLSIATLNFNTTPNQTYSLGGNPLTLTTSLTIGNGSTGIIANINVDLVLNAASISFNSAANQILNLNNPISEVNLLTNVTRGTGTGTINWNGANTFSGNLSLNGAGINVFKSIADTVSSSMGTGTGTISLNGTGGNAGFRFIGTDPGATDRNVLIGDGGTSNEAINIVNNSVDVEDSLTLRGTIVMTSPTKNKTLTLAGTNTGDNLVSGAISSTGTGALSLAKSGVGRWSLSGSNTYTGTTTISGGILKLGSSSALGFGGRQATSANLTTVTSVGTLDLNGQTVNEQIVLSGTGSGSIGALVNNSATAASIGSGVAGMATSTGGTGYSETTILTLTGGGTGATATVNLGLTNLSFTPGVIGDKVYTVAPTVTLTGGGGTGATATAFLTSGQVTSIIIANPGVGYTTVPTVTLSDGTFTSGTTDTAFSGDETKYTVINARMTNTGSGYTSAPTVAFSNQGAGTGATLPADTTLSSVTLAADSSVGGTGNIEIDAAVGETGGARSLSKVGNSTLTLSGTNTYTGATAVSAGTLLINGATSTGAVTVASSATLGGSGTVGGAVTLDTNGNLSPGAPVNNASILTINGALDVSSAAPYVGLIRMDLNTPAGTNDRINVGGQAIIGAGALGLNDFAFTNLGGLAVGSYTLISAAGGISGTLDSANLTGTFAPGFNGALSISGNNIVLNVTVAGSDPYSVWSGGAGFYADTNNDGVSNGLAWFLGAANVTVSALNLLPVPTVSGGNLTLSTFNRVNPMGSAKLFVEYSNNLTTWTSTETPATNGNYPTGNITIVVAGGPAPATQTIAITVSSEAASGGKLFARLKAVELP